MKNSWSTEMEKSQLKEKGPDVRVGDRVRVFRRVVEKSRDRVQVLEGTVMGKQGSGLSESFTIHRVAHKHGMCCSFLVHSPRLEAVEVVCGGKVRRAKLNYLKGAYGKRAKVRESVVRKKK